MPFTGGGWPLDPTVGCRWCDMDFEDMTHSRALVALLNHVQRAHPVEFAEAAVRPGPRTPSPSDEGAMSDEERAR